MSLHVGVCVCPERQKTVSLSETIPKAGVKQRKKVRTGSVVCLSLTWLNMPCYISHDTFSHYFTLFYSACLRRKQWKSTSNVKYVLIYFCEPFVQLTKILWLSQRIQMYLKTYFNHICFFMSYCPAHKQ